MIVTLKSQAELQQSRDQLSRRGLDFSDPRKSRLWRLLYHVRYRDALPPADIMKSWDVFHALRTIETAVPDRRTPILDMGCFNSEIVYALHLLKYEQLYGCDLNPMCRWMPYWHSVRYARADLTATPYADRSFGALTCLSVIEHGVPLDALADEVDRLLRPDGIFLFTTDFDATGKPHEIDPEFEVFGQSWTIFQPETLALVIDRFLGRGYRLLNPTMIDQAHVECPIGWNGQEYTFTFVALRKPGI